MGPGQGKPWDGGDTKRAEPPPERTGIDATAARAPGIPFPAAGEAILYRWAVERDTAVSAGGIARVRACRHRSGVGASAVPDRRLPMDGAETRPVSLAGR